MPPLPELFEAADRLKADLDALRPLDPEREARVLQKFRLWWTYHSNAIEGNVLTQGETEVFLMEGLTAKGKPLKDHLDLRGHSDAINYLLDLVRSNEPLTEHTIRELHKILLVEPYPVDAITPDGHPTKKMVVPGQYKTEPNHVLTPTGEIHYYATPAETPAKMNDLMQWWRDTTAKGTMHPIETAARFHHRFAAIHPFDDGNGRMSRILMNLLLMQAQYPPVVIRLIERDLYLAALRRADAGEEEDFLVFIGEHAVQSLDLYVRAANGEEIAEPSDTEKEITLLTMELDTGTEPQPVTQEAQKRLFENSLDPLFAEIARLLKPLAELFSESSVRVSESYGTDGRLMKPNFSLPLEGDRIPLHADSFADSSTVSSVELRLKLTGFKNARYSSFHLATDVLFHFQQLKYTITAPAFKPPARIQHFYQESLSKDEIRKFADAVARFFLESVREKTRGAGPA